jgi:hypothetical protein
MDYRVGPRQRFVFLILWFSVRVLFGLASLVYLLKIPVHVISSEARVGLARFFPNIKNINKNNKLHITFTDCSVHLAVDICLLME